MTENLAKGAVINGFLKFVKKKWGQIGLNDAMKYAGVSMMPKDGEWVPAVKFDMVLEWIAKNKGMDNVKGAGKNSAKDLGIFGYIFGAVIGTEKILKRMKHTYPSIFNYGEVVLEFGDNNAVVTIKGAAISEYDCPAWEGALTGFMEIARCHGHVKVLEPDSPKDCKYILEWK